MLHGVLKHNSKMEQKFNPVTTFLQHVKSLCKRTNTVLMLYLTCVNAEVFLMGGVTQAIHF